MSRRAAIVEEFEDDEDDDVGSRPLPNTANGPLLEEIYDWDVEMEPTLRPGPASGSPSPLPPRFQPPFTTERQDDSVPVVTSIEPYKK
jgi:hypothetical protein